jgi:hypothetical protein
VLRVLGTVERDPDVAVLEVPANVERHPRELLVRSSFEQRLDRFVDTAVE